MTQGVVPESHDPTWLYRLCIPAAICTIICSVWYAMTFAKSNPVQRLVAGPLLVACLAFFGGVGLGVYLESAAAGHADHATHGEHGDHDHGDHNHGDAGHEHGDNPAEPAHAEPAKASSMHTPSMEAPVGKLVSTEATIIPGQAHPDQVFVDPKIASVDHPEVNQRGKAGLFFGIYYCMTGVHAIHIIGGMVVISWLIWKAAHKEFHSKYFGPVDNVGLYWHLVDFLWIYLFPLLYLIK
jgi:cytochrome c oxidase subunit 3